MKKWLASLLALLMVTTMLPMTVFAQEITFEIFEGTEEIRMPLYGYKSYYSNADEIGATDVTWTVNDETVLYIGDDYVEARKVGTATLTATTDNGATDSVTVTVYPDVTWNGLGTKTVYLSPLYPARTFKFTAAEDGYYRLFSSGDVDPALEILEAGGAYLNGSDDENDMNFDTTMWLTAGDVYYLYVKVYGNVPAAFEMTVEKAAEEDTEEVVVAFENESLTLCLGDFVQPLYVFNPLTSDDTVTMTVSDTNVLYLDGETLGAQGLGTATVTIETASGYSDTLSVTVGDPRILTMDTPLTAEIANSMDSRAFWFIPETSGVYTFRSINETGDPYAALMDAEGNLIFESDDDSVSLNFRMEIDCEAGEVYALYTTTYSGSAAYDVVVTKSVAATTVDLSANEDDPISQSGDTYYILTGNYIDFEVTFGDTYGAIAEDVWLETSDDSVLSISGFSAEAIAAGTAQVTVTSDNGLTDAVTVVVIEAFMGDVTLDGSFNMMDVMALYNLNSGNQTNITDTGKAMGEVTGDNVINMMDVMAMYNKASGK